MNIFSGFVFSAASRWNGEEPGDGLAVLRYFCLT